MLLKIRSNAMKFVNLLVMSGRIGGVPGEKQQAAYGVPGLSAGAALAGKNEGRPEERVSPLGAVGCVVDHRKHRPP
jgi:hypothetical protein